MDIKMYFPSENASTEPKLVCTSSSLNVINLYIFLQGKIYKFVTKNPHFPDMRAVRSF